MLRREEERAAAKKSETFSASVSDSEEKGGGTKSSIRYLSPLPRATENFAKALPPTPSCSAELQPDLVECLGGFGSAPKEVSGVATSVPSLAVFFLGGGICCLYPFLFS